MLTLFLFMLGISGAYVCVDPLPFMACWPFNACCTNLLTLYLFKQMEDFSPYFSGRKKLLPRPTDLSFYNWDTNHSSSNSTPNYQVKSVTVRFTQGCKAKGLVWGCWMDFLKCKPFMFRTLCKVPVHNANEDTFFIQNVSEIWRFQCCT